MNKLGLLVMPLMAVSLLANCGGGSTPSEDVKFSIKESSVTLKENNTIDIHLDWNPSGDIIEFSNFTFTLEGQTSITSTVTPGTTGDRPLALTVTFNSALSTNDKGNLSFDYNDKTIKKEGKGKVENININIAGEKPSFSVAESTVDYDEVTRSAMVELNWEPASDYLTFNNLDFAYGGEHAEEVAAEATTSPANINIKFGEAGLTEDVTGTLSFNYTDTTTGVTGEDKIENITINVDEPEPTIHHISMVTDGTDIMGKDLPTDEAYVGTISVTADGKILDGLTLVTLKDGNDTDITNDCTYTPEVDSKSASLEIPLERLTNDIEVEVSLTDEPGPVEYSVIKKLTLKDNETDYYKVTFDYFADNQYVENESIDNIGVYHKIYHIIEKTGDGGYVDYSIEANPSEANSDFELSDIAYYDTYNANGKIISSISLTSEEYINTEYPGYDCQQLEWIELTFADFEATKFYCTGSNENLYNNSALLKSVNKNLYDDEDNKVLSLVTASVTEDIYNNESRLVGEYMFNANGGSTVMRMDYTFDANDLITDDAGYMLEPRGSKEEFSTFIQTFDINESSFRDYGQEHGFTELACIGASAYMHKKTADPNTFETEYFSSVNGVNKYLLANYLGDYGAYYKTTYGEYGSYKDEIYAYTLSSPEPTEGQTREGLQFLDLTPGDLKGTHEVVYDDYQNCIKDVYTIINAGVPVIVNESYEYTIDEGKITQYDNYPIDGAVASTVVEYTTNDNDYGQTFGWVYNNIKKLHSYVSYQK